MSSSVSYISVGVAPEIGAKIITVELERTHAGMVSTKILSSVVARGMQILRETGQHYSL
jgi:hypothetical protein